MAAKVREFGMRYPVVAGDDAIVAGFGGLIGFPTTFVIDKNWRIVRKYMGSLPDKHDRMRHDIDQLLSE